MSAFGSAYGSAFVLPEALNLIDNNKIDGDMTNYYRHYDGTAWIADQNITISYGRFDVLRQARWHKVKTEYVGDVEVVGNSYLLTPCGFE